MADLWPEKWLPEVELAPYLNGADLATSNWGTKARALLAHQYDTWPEYREARDNFIEVQTRPMVLGGTEVILQHNHGRRVNVAARVDPADIQQRPCFLCVHRLYENQRALPWNERLNLLVNPAPIVREHLTIVSSVHQPQLLVNGLGDLPELCCSLAPEFTVCYNGPRCGASAPDHFHFQALGKGATPFETQLDRIEWLYHVHPSLSRRSVHFESGGERFTTAPPGNIASPCAAQFGKGRRVEIGLWTDSIRSAAVLISDDAGALLQAIHDVGTVLRMGADEEDEPMFNLLAWYEASCWIVALFPRIKHRPECYFAEGEARRLISPGSIDMAGLIVAPDPRDFDRLDSNELMDIFRQVCRPPQELRRQLRLLTKDRL